MAQIMSAIALPSSLVDALPPRSRVRGPFANTCSVRRRVVP
jgi:hypothetical protein